MATPNRPATSTEYTEQNMGNTSYDTEFGVNTIELLGYDPLASALKRITTNALNEYQVNDIEELASVTFIGKEDPAGSWFIQQIATSSGSKNFTYATLNNNPSTTDYSTAWANRAGLNYGTYGAAF